MVQDIKINNKYCSTSRNMKPQKFPSTKQLYLINCIWTFGGLGRKCSATF